MNTGITNRTRRPPLPSAVKDWLTDQLIADGYVDETGGPWCRRIAELLSYATELEEFAEYRATILVTLLLPMRKLGSMLPAVRLRRSKEGATGRLQKVDRNIRAQHNLSGEWLSYQVYVNRYFNGERCEFTRHMQTLEQAVSYRDRLVKAHADGVQQGLSPDQIKKAMWTVPLYEL